MWILDLNQLSARSWESLICSRIDRVTIPSESLPLVGERAKMEESTRVQESTSFDFDPKYTYDFFSAHA